MRQLSLVLVFAQNILVKYHPFNLLHAAFRLEISRK